MLGEVAPAREMSPSGSVMAISQSVLLPSIGTWRAKEEGSRKIVQASREIAASIIALDACAAARFAS